MSKSQWLKVIAAIFAVLSFLILTTIFPSLNNTILYAVTQNKYMKLDEALSNLSSFEELSLKTPQGDKNYTVSILHQNDSGFNELLNIIYKKLVINYEKQDVSRIMIIKETDSWMIAGYEVIPHYVLCIVVDNDVKTLAVQDKNTIASWMETEKQYDLQILSFYLLIFAVIFDLIADVDLTSIFKKGKKAISPPNKNETLILNREENENFETFE
jgi:hypothetical protein